MKKTKTTKRKVGRPKLSKGKTCRIAITITDDLLDQIKSRAKRLDMCVSAYVRYAIEHDAKFGQYYF